MVVFQGGYNSNDEVSDPDEEDGQVYTHREYHDSGATKLYRTYQIMPRPDGKGTFERMIEEKHFNPDGVCMVDIHFSVGQSFLSRKHYHPSQSLKSEKLFFVDDEVTMQCRKVGHWRDYYDGGGIKKEMVYDNHGVRTGFCKRYHPDGSIAWIKDYTKEYEENLRNFKNRMGKLELSAMDAARVLGFETFPTCVHEVNRQYRILSLPLHPDKQGANVSDESTEKFIALSRARDLLRENFEKTPPVCKCE
eukprot:CAMPEP_0182443516 /NCGR_PEP_ID=MMETSP1172-20130603/2236_1 /TAXON_ID=708627 /ORGANISM="Timspurckia oligopyrenoides, Strain CCMP3278" /LENGTH=248 /DNA_ID=CAMNT_0024638829 /DNA_START=159 /DNA_END=905 /DNA_ORIENTATION=-